ncbi:MAG: Do family serine endopeptidase [bacterium]|nr:Do family serine endopeptidase [bacterium]
MLNYIKKIILVTLSLILAFFVITVIQNSFFKKEKGKLPNKTSVLNLRKSPAILKVNNELPKETLSSLSSLEEAFSKISEETKPAVVNLSVMKKIDSGFQMFRDKSYFPFDGFFEDFFDNIPSKKYNQESLGSGVIIKKEGYILTNDHVIKGADSIKVTLLDGRSFEGKVIGIDSKTDLALIKVDVKNNLPIAKIGDSDKAKIGSWVIAVGNPYGLEHTVTVGVISAKGRTIGLAEYEDFIQTDASINPGNSGGPLVNIKGEVIGINTAIVAQAQGIGFAIPINIAVKVIDSLIKHGKVTRAWLGIVIQDITPELSKLLGVSPKSGVLVSDLSKNSPAEKAGVQRKDIIKAINNKTVTSVRELQREVLKKNVEDVVTLSIMRNGKLMSIKIILKELPDEPKVAKRPDIYYWRGITAQKLTQEIAKHFNIKEGRGIIISNVKIDTPAYKASLIEGDIIEEIEKNKIMTIEDFIKVTKKIKPEEEALLLIKRESTTMYIAIGKE